MTTIHKLMSEVLKIPLSHVTDDLSMKHAKEWDSLKHMELIVAIEQMYGIELTGDEIADMTSVFAIKNILSRYGH